MEAHSVLCAVRTEPSYLMYADLSLQWLKKFVFGACTASVTANSAAAAICVCRNSSGKLQMYSYIFIVTSCMLLSHSTTIPTTAHI